MKLSSKIIAVAVAACALALTSTTALAAEFAASRIPPITESEPGQTKGHSIGGEFAQEFVFGPFHIKCDKAKAYAKTVGEGAITWESSQTFATEVKFAKCLTEAHFGAFTAGLATRFNEGKPIKILYHINGYAEFGTGVTESEVQIGSGEANFKISGKICKINWPAQTVPARAENKPEEEFSAAVYSNKEVAVEEKMWKKFPTHFQKRLVITHEFNGMAWEFEEGQCVGEGGFEEEAAKTEGKSGKYKGAIEEELKGGNLSFVP
jgi:hypothetical protein